MIMIAVLLAAPHLLRVRSQTGDPQDCTVVLENGRKIAVTRFWHVTNERVEYESDGSLHDLAASEIRSIRCGEETFTIDNDSLRAVCNTPVLNDVHASERFVMADGSIDYHALGKADGKKYYKGGGALAGSYLTSLMIVPPLIIGAVPPASPRANNPNAELYWKEPAYKKGYRSAAHGKKASLAALGFMLGFVTVAALASY